MKNTKIKNQNERDSQVFTLSRALQNAIVMRAEYSGGRVKFTEYRK